MTMPNFVMVHQSWVRKMPAELAKVDELTTFPLHFISVNTFTVVVYEWFKLTTFVEENQKLIFGIFGISDPLETVIKIITKIALYIFTSSMVFYLCVGISSDEGYMELGGLKKY